MCSGSAADHHRDLSTLEMVWKVHPQLKLKVFVIDIEASMFGETTWKFCKAVPMVVSVLKSVIQEVQFKLSFTERAKEGQTKLIAPKK